MKRIALLAMAGVLLASVTGCGSSAQAADAEYIYGQIDSVSGNDIVLLLADYHEDAGSGSADAGKEKPSEDSGSERKRPDKGKMPEDFDPSQFSGEKPEGFSKPENGEMPENFDPSQYGGKMPKRSSESEDSEAPKDSDASKSSHRRSGSSKYTLTGEQEELRIPVGTTVTTAAGVETDFDVLKSGDYIRCSVETDSDGKTVVTSVQIMEA